MLKAGLIHLALHPTVLLCVDLKRHQQQSQQLATEGDWEQKRVRGGGGRVERGAKKEE